MAPQRFIYQGTKRIAGTRSLVHTFPFVCHLTMSQPLRPLNTTAKGGFLWALPARQCGCTAVISPRAGTPLKAAPRSDKTNDISSDEPNLRCPWTPGNSPLKVWDSLSKTKRLFLTQGSETSHSQQILGKCLTACWINIYEIHVPKPLNHWPSPGLRLDLATSKCHQEFRKHGGPLKTSGFNRMVCLTFLHLPSLRKSF